MNNLLSNIPASVQLYLPALGVLLLATIVLLVLRTILKRHIKALRARAEKPRHLTVLELIHRILLPVLFLVTLSFALTLTQFSTTVRKIINIGFLMVGTYIAIRATNRIVETTFITLVEKDPRRTTQANNLKVLLSFIQLLVWAAGILILLSTLGVDITTAVAGLGIGGIAVAVAAQGTLGDLFSYFVILFDHPFGIGDYIVFDDKSGTVEKIGVKSTQIRVKNGELLIVANKDLTASRIHNYKRMEKRLLVATYNIPFDTPYEKLEKIPSLIAQVVSSIKTFEGITLDRSHFKTIGKATYEFESAFYVPSPGYIDLLNVQNEMNYKMVKLFEEEGIRFAVPTYKLQED
ncbi:MAG: mechanosensitive ion channel family protein [Spirochaetales bacterium]|nr:mechanosensitive ion channel family protein [Spirochaetales bacterium]